MPYRVDDNEHPMPDRERMSSVDTAWLRMDRATNRMVIVGILLFDTAVDYERLKATLEARLAGFERFRRRPIEDATGAWWEATPRFNLAPHVRRVKLPGSGGAAALRRYVARLVPKPFDPRRPWWEYILVEGYNGGSALIARIHHCYADGIALTRVLLSLTDDSPDAPPAAPAAPARRQRATPRHEGLLHQLFDPLADLATGALRWSGDTVGKSMEVLLHPEKVMQFAQVGAAVAREIAKLATMPDDSRTRFKGRAGEAKAVAWTEPLALDEVKAVGKVLGCSVNDVLLATVAGALRRYLVAQGDPTGGIELRAMVPVNLRSPSAEIELGNKFGLVTLLLPVGIANPLARLYEVHHRMEALKDSYQAPIALALLGLAGLVPKALQQQMLDVLANKATAVMTNVPGPQQPLYMAGGRLGQMMFWVPQSGDIGMGVSILSYDGRVQFGLITDAGRVPDPENVVAHFIPEFDRLLMTVLMEPWDTPRDPALVERELRAVLRGKRSRRKAAADPSPAVPAGAPPATAVATPPAPPSRPRRRGAPSRPAA